MRLALAVRLGPTALRRHRLRPLLTVPGMIIGVAAVISVAAVDRGRQFLVEASLLSTGGGLLGVLVGLAAAHGFEASRIEPIDALRFE